MSEHGEVFHERMYEGAELRHAELTDINNFVSIWQELSDTRQTTADQALSELVDSLEPDEYTAAVHAFIGELELFRPHSKLRGEGFYMSGARGDIGMFPDGVFYRRMANDRRTIHRTIASMQDELEGDLHDCGLTVSLDRFKKEDYDYTRPTIRILSAWHTDKVELDEHNLEAKVHEIVADSGIWIFGQERFPTTYKFDAYSNTWVVEEDPFDRYSINGSAAADLIDYVADRLLSEDRVVFANTMDDFFEQLTGNNNERGHDVYTPFFDQNTYGQSWEAESTVDSPGGIYQVIGTWDEMIRRIGEDLVENEVRLNEDERSSEKLLRFLGLHDEHASLYNGVPREFLLSVRGQPKLPFVEA